MGCFSGEEAKTNFELPGYLKSPSKAIGKGVVKALDQPYQAYTGDRVAGMSGTQNDALSMFKSLFGENGEGTAIPRLIDDIPGMGPLSGSIADYMDPYLASVLSPVLRDLGRVRDDRGQALDAERHMAGAFGDTGAAFAEGELDRGYMEEVGDATGRISSDAFQSAMGMRSEDINRLMTNRSQQGDWLKQLFNMGGVEQATEQRDLDADFQEFMRMIGFDMDQLAKAASITGSLPSGSAVTTPGEASPFAKALGSLSTAAAMLI